MQALRLAARSLAATPIVTSVAVLSLALGIGANTAIFSIIDSLLLRALPVDRPERLVLLLSNPTVIPASPFSNPVWEQIRDRQADFSASAFAFSRRTGRFDFARGGQTDFVDGIYASGRYFEALGVKPILGRTFTMDDDRRDGGPAGPVAIISYALWQRRFGGTAAVIGKAQTIERVLFTIIGVMPPDFFGTDVGTRADVILPLGIERLIRGPDSMLDRPTTSALMIMARLRDGQTIASAEAALRAIQPGIREATMPANVSAEARARYLTAPFALESAASGTSAMRVRYREPLLAIMAVMALVLLVACANVANLFLARASARRHEFSVRLALGATRWRLARQPFVECLVVSAAGGACALATAQWVGRLLIRQLSTNANTVFLDMHFDWRLLAFTGATTFAVALLFGVVPALRATRTDPIEAIREQSRSIAGDRGFGPGGVLVGVQVALSLVVVVAAGLFIRTFTRLAGVNLGFDRDPVLLVRLDAPPAGLPGSERLHTYEQVAAAVRAVPGVAHAAVSEITPVSGMITDAYVEIEDSPLVAPTRNVTYTNMITPDWFATFGTRLVEGRDFDERDRTPAPPVAIVNETFARRFLPGKAAIGRRIRYPSDAAATSWMTIVGVVADANYLSLREQVPPTMYVPIGQELTTGTFPSMSLSVRAAGARPAQLARPVSEAIARVNPEIAVTFTLLKQQLDGALVQERMMALLSGSFGTLTLILSALGLYGVTAYAVSRQRMEIGVRIALGAAPSTVLKMVLKRITVPVAIGVAVGAAVSSWASKYVSAQLYGLEPRDAVTLLGAAGILVSVAMFAASVPAWNAAQTDPVTVLREP
jgi:putative ABC transport system permease protein